MSLIDLFEVLEVFNLLSRLRGSERFFEVLRDFKRFLDFLNRFFIGFFDDFRVFLGKSNKIR